MQKNKPPRPGLVWEDRTYETREKIDSSVLPILKHDKSKSITKLNGTDNILIEGDNYRALQILNYTHKGKIDVIYIDPPYNTGSKTWKYNNNFIDQNDSYRHSKWVNFMYKRLHLTRQLLKKTGVICITIDNYEIHNLKHIMEEIFSDRDIIITVIEHNFQGRAKNNFALTHEYALWAVPNNIESITRLDEKSDDIRRNLRRTGQGSRRSDSPTMFFGIEVNKNNLDILSVTKPILNDYRIIKPSNKNSEYIFPIDNNGNERRWYYSPKTVMNEYKKGHIYAKKIRNKIEIHYWKAGNNKRRKSVWSNSKYDGSTYGSELLTEIIGENDFPFPKSLYAVKECIESMTNKKDAVILDFFAGSGTTGHAVLQLNSDDDGARKFILCTNNEGDICTNICHPRLKKVIKGYKIPKKEKIKGLGSRLHYFKINDKTRPDKVDKRRITNQIAEILCVKETCFDLKTNENNGYRIYKNGKNGNYFGIIYTYEAILKYLKAVKTIKCSTIPTYVFSHDCIVSRRLKKDKVVRAIPVPGPLLTLWNRGFSQ